MKVNCKGKKEAAAKKECNHSYGVIRQPCHGHKKQEKLSSKSCNEHEKQEKWSNKSCNEHKKQKEDLTRDSHHQVSMICMLVNLMNVFVCEPCCMHLCTICMVACIYKPYVYLHEPYVCLWAPIWMHLYIMFEPTWSPTCMPKLYHGDLFIMFIFI